MRRRGPFMLAVAIVVGTLIDDAVVAQPLPEAQTRTRSIAPFVAEAAQRFGLPEAWIWAVIRVESRGDPRAVSPAGAMGLMQVMPATWAALRARQGLGSDPFDAHDNVIAGTAFLRLLHDRYGDPAAMLAAYNAGPGRYDDWLARRRPLPAETVAYLARLGDVTGGTTSAPPLPDPLAWTRAPLFIRARLEDPGAAPVRPRGASETPSQRVAAANDARPDTLFVARWGAGSAP